jgi:hypothetical protein
MKITRQQKIYGAVLGLALAAWGIDAAASGKDSAVRPAAPGAGAGGNPAKSPVIAGRTAEGLPSQSVAVFSAKLQTFVDADGNLPETRDAFRPSELWISDAGRGKDVTVQAFLQAHQLKTVISSDRIKAVVVDSSLLKLGDEIDGFRLVEISSMSARFSSGGRTVDLQIQTGQGT